VPRRCLIADCGLEITRPGAEYSGVERMETEFARGGKNLRGGIEAAEVQGSRPEVRAKGAAAKKALAARLRAETTPTARWIAARLSMGTRGALNHRLNRWSKPREQEPSSRTDPLPSASAPLPPPSPPPPPAKLPSKKWRDLILQVWHTDPLICPQC
jgi:hypothetical protein